MTKKVIKDQKAKDLDQFYTDPSYASIFLDKIKSIVNFDQYDIILEPSAGTGSFFNLLDNKKRIGLDLDPKTSELIKINFFDWIPSSDKIITIGNPPFGKNSRIAVDFFNQAAKFSEIIAFVLPRTFRKTSIVNRLDKNFHLIYDETVPDNSFIFNDSPYNVWCCSQIWMKKSIEREPIETLKFSQISHWFEIVDPLNSNFAIQRVGGRAGLIRTAKFKEYSPESHYFIKQYDKRVLQVFKNVNFDSVKFNTAGNPSISPDELIRLWILEAEKQNLTIKLLPIQKKPINNFNELFHN